MAEALSGVRTRMKKDARREAILAEAIGIIGEHGFRSFSLNKLAVRCGLTNAGVLHYFGSKDGLLVALLQERDRRDEGAVAKLLHAHGLTEPLSRDGIGVILRAIVARNANQPELVRLYAVLRAEALVPDHPAYAYFSNRERATIDLFSQMVAGQVTDSASTGRAISALMNGLEVQWLRENLGFDLVAEWDKIASKILT